LSCLFTLVVAPIAAVKLFRLRPGAAVWGAVVWGNIVLHHLALACFCSPLLSLELPILVGIVLHHLAPACFRSPLVSLDLPLLVGSALVFAALPIVAMRRVGSLSDAPPV
jgi:hypothetical protein